MNTLNVPAAQQLRFARKAPAKKVAPKKPVDNLIKDQHKRASNRQPWIPTFSSAFRLIILVRFFAAMYTSISDCDEGAILVLDTGVNADSVGCSVQLLGTVALFDGGQGISNVGVFASVGHQILRIPTTPRSLGPNRS